MPQSTSFAADTTHKMSDDRAPRDRAPRAQAAPASGSGSSSSDGHMRVKADSRVKIVAGAIAQKIRPLKIGECLHIDAIGSGSVNAAIKSIIIARDYLERDDNMDLLLTATHLEDIGRDAYTLVVTKNPKGRVAESDGAVEVDGGEDGAEDGKARSLRIAGTTKPGSLAGAIAGTIRDGAASVTTSGIGPLSVLKAVKALSLASTYLADTHAIACAPRFVDMKMGDAERTGIRFVISAQKK